MKKSKEKNAFMLQKQSIIAIQVIFTSRYFGQEPQHNVLYVAY
jgi:hypothetical protein